MLLGVATPTLSAGKGTKLIETDLRDSGGNKMLVMQVEVLDGSYQTGGLPLYPENFGFNEIVFASIGNVVSLPYGEGGIWDPVALMSLQYVDSTEFDGFASPKVWKLAISSYNGSKYEELEDGAIVTLPPEFKPILMIIGA